MRIDVENMLRQAGRAAGNRYGYEFSLGHLAECLQELRDRTVAGDMAALDEFFKLYVFDDGKDYADLKRVTAPQTEGDHNG